MILSAASAQSADYRVDSNVWFEGSSTVRDWACKDVPAESSLALPGTPESTEALHTLLRTTPDTQFRTTVRIPVREIRCEQGETMNGHMRDALKAKKYPTITYDLNRVTVGDRIDTTPAKFRANLSGDLTIKQTTRSIDIPVTVHVTESGEVRVTGDLPLDMTKFTVKPPTVMWTITVYDDITIHLDADWTLADESRPNKE